MPAGRTAFGVRLRRKASIAGGEYHRAGGAGALPVLGAFLVGYITIGTAAAQHFIIGTVVLLGFLISWLMIHSRRREFALMRGCGAQRWRVFASFFLEQGILCLAGCLVGCIGFFWLYAGGVAQPLAVAAYLVCYLLGATISIQIISKTNLMELLTIRE